MLCVFHEKQEDFVSCSGFLKLFFFLFFFFSFLFSSSSFISPLPFRYSQLRNIHKALLEKHKGEPHRAVQIEACGFPSRRPFSMSAFSDRLVQERKAQVQKYLSNLFD